MPEHRKRMSLPSRKTLSQQHPQTSACRCFQYCSQEKHGFRSFCKIVVENGMQARLGADDLAVADHEAPTANHNSTCASQVVRSLQLNTTNSLKLGALAWLGTCSHELQSATKSVDCRLKWERHIATRMRQVVTCSASQ